MIWILAWLTVVLTSPFSESEQAAVSKHHVQIKSSKFIIYGETNVNKFDCDLFRSSGAGMLTVSSTWSDFNIDFDGLVLKYKIEEFNCGHPIMNRDFCDILESTSHPFLFLKINEIYIDKERSEMEKLDVTSFVTVSLAGVEKTQLIEDATIINHSDNELTFTGRTLLSMTDFGIEPPTKFLGLVSVNNQLSVAFEIQLIVTPINK